MDVVSDAKKFAQPALDPDSVLTFLRLCLGRSLSGKLKSEVAFQQCVPLLPFFFFKCTWQLWTLRSNGAWSHCLLNKSFMRRNPEIIALDREQTTVLRIHCSIGCFHKSCTFFSVPYYVSEVKPTTCFAVIRERFAIWLKVQLPRAAFLDCSSFSPMIDLSLTLFIRLLQCLSCYSKGRIAINLFFFKWKFNPRPCK